MSKLLSKYAELKFPRSSSFVVTVESCSQTLGTELQTFFYLGH